MRFSHVTASSGHPKGEAAALFADRINEEMNGRMCVEVFPNSQLYNDNKVLEALVLGDVEMAAPSLSKFEQFTLSFRIFDLPFLFEDVAAVDRFRLLTRHKACWTACRIAACKVLVSGTTA